MICISDKQYKKFNEQVEKLGQEYEEKHYAKDKHYKFKGIAFVDHKMQFEFKDGEPWKFFHDGKDLGIFTLEKRNDSDVSFNMSPNVQNYLKTSQGDFRITLEIVNDGAVYAYNITIFECFSPYDF